MKKLVFIIFILLITFSITISRAQSIIPITGGVYVANIKIEIRDLKKSSIYPILAFRIDNIDSDTLWFKYRFGFELVGNAKFVYKDSCECYKSTDKIYFAPLGYKRLVCSKKEILYMKVNSQNDITLSYYRNDTINKKLYKLTHTYEVDQINLNDPYYHENGFRLFKEELRFFKDPHKTNE